MTDRKRRLIFLWTYVEWGGAQIYLLAVMKKAKELFDIVVVLPRESMPDILGFLDKLDIRYEYIDVCLDLSQAPTIGDKIRRQWRRIHAEIKTFAYLSRYDLSTCVLHIETSPWQSWILLTSLALRRAHVFVTMHNIMPRAPSWREFIWRIRLQFVSRLPRFHIFPSNLDTKNRLKGWVSDSFFDQMVVTYTAVDPVEIANVSNLEVDISAMRVKHGIEKGTFLVLCVGQFIDRKGRWIFLEAAERINGIDKNVSFAWVTPKKPDAAALARIAEYGLGEKFRIVVSRDLGNSRQDVLKFFRVADVFALASFVEGLPIALLEAMALGIPSISTTVNAIPEAIVNDQTGLLVEAGDSVALAKSILRLKEDSDLRYRLADAGREFVLTRFDERRVADLVIESYERSLGSE